MNNNIKVPKRLYLDKYFIALYDNDDNIYGVYDNPLDLAKHFDLNPKWVYKIVQRLFSGQRKTFRKLRPYFIDPHDDSKNAS